MNAGGLWGMLPRYIGRYFYSLAWWASFRPWLYWTPSAGQLLARSMKSEVLGWIDEIVSSTSHSNYWLNFWIPIWGYAFGDHWQWYLDTRCTRWHRQCDMWLLSPHFCSYYVASILPRLIVLSWYWVGWLLNGIGMALTDWVDEFIVEWPDYSWVTIGECGWEVCFLVPLWIVCSMGLNIPRWSLPVDLQELIAPKAWIRFNKQKGIIIKQHFKVPSFK